jgi:hypothetical protein
MDDSLRETVVNRAADKCEYCGLPQSAVDLKFHVDHIVSRQHGGGLDLDNLCLACDRCNLKKGPNLSAIDPESGEVVRLFHPRLQSWREHFLRVRDTIIGRTATGRATASLLEFNAARRRELRTELVAEGVIPAIE